MPTLKIRDERVSVSQNRTLATYTGPVTWLFQTGEADLVIVLPPWSGSDMVTLLNIGSNSVLLSLNPDGAQVCGLSELPDLTGVGSRLRLVPNTTLGWTALNPIMSVE